MKKYLTTLLIIGAFAMSVPCEAYMPYGYQPIDFNNCTPALDRIQQDCQQAQQRMLQRDQIRVQQEILNTLQRPGRYGG